MGIPPKTIQERIDVIKRLREQGVNPYPSTVTRTHTIDEARNAGNKMSVAVVGRLRSLRGHGKIIFGDLNDESGNIQIVFKTDILPPEHFKLLKSIDEGDFLAVEGTVGKTEAGELSVFAGSITIVSKTIAPLPDRWFGLKDVEERYRKRYLDLLMNPEVKQRLDARWKIEKYVRMFLWKERYVEVETPVLQPLYGGTNAKPFTTHMNALDSDFYLRVAPELYLKRLMVGGYERVFEIARNFRNEGIDHTHQPEFTMIEWYEAYADYLRIMNMTEELIKYLAKEVNGTLTLQVGDHAVDLSQPWKRLTIDDAMKEYAGIDWEKISDEQIQKTLKEQSITVPGVYSRNKALFRIYEHTVTKQLIEPTWVIDYPQEVSPLSKSHRSKPGRVERFEGYIAGKEIFDGWSEIVSSIEQRERFENEQKNMKAGDDEAQPLDEDFLAALSYGCPPLGGIGIGIDRLTMLLTNTWAIKEIIAFPTLKPLQRIKAAAATSVPNSRGVLHTPSPKTHTNMGVRSTPLQQNIMKREEAIELLHAHMQNANLRRHCYAVETVMRALAKHFSEDEDVWGIAGLLHDADYEETKEITQEHSHRVVSWLKEKHADTRIINAILAHAWKFVEVNPEPSNEMEWSLYCCDELTGFIVAVALIKGKSLANVTVESVLKKFPVTGFAAGVHRPQIKLCEEKLGIKLEDFVGIALKAMQDIHQELGL